MIRGDGVAPTRVDGRHITHRSTRGRVQMCDNEGMGWVLSNSAEANLLDKSVAVHNVHRHFLVRREPEPTDALSAASLTPVRRRSLLAVIVVPTSPLRSPPPRWRVTSLAFSFRANLPPRSLLSLAAAPPPSPSLAPTPRPPTSSPSRRVDVSF
ncbi:hypothetical protein AB1Y20_013840 [Prymnesium parvum]